MSVSECGCYLAEFGQAYVHTRPEAGAQVGGTCEDVAQMLIPHEFPASLLDQMLHLQDNDMLTRKLCIFKHGE